MGGKEGGRGLTSEEAEAASIGFLAFLGEGVRGLCASL